jgi:hypothetical protein
MGVSVQDLHADEPVENWSPRWLAYSRYDGIVLHGSELAGLAGSAEGQAVRAALLQYVESGGVLLVVGRGPLALPDSWQQSQEAKRGGNLYRGGFGLCLHVPDPAALQKSGDLTSLLASAWRETGSPYQGSRTMTDVNRAFPIVEDVGLPVLALLSLMVLFTVVIGPLNIYLLSVWKRRIWLLWTVPVIAATTCAMVFGFMIVAEGWQGRSRVAGFTILDEKEKRATTLGHSAYYSPLTPGEGLHYSQETEVTMLGVDNPSATPSACSLDWTKDQHLSRGWVTARVPAHFQLKASQQTVTQRLSLARDDKGSLAVTNGLGVHIKKLWLVDQDGKLSSADAVPAGATVTLTPTGNKVAARAKTPLRSLYQKNEWGNLGEVASAPENYLTPRSYLAVVESSPFLEQGLVGAQQRQADSYILGLMGE